jgi:hypothetical protein
VTGDEMRGTAAATRTQRGFAKAFDDFRMAREAEIIVAAEVDEALAVDDNFRPAVGQRKGLNGATPSPQMLAIDFGERALQRGGVAFHGELPVLRSCRSSVDGRRRAVKILMQ